VRNNRATGGASGPVSSLDFARTRPPRFESKGGDAVSAERKRLADDRCGLAAWKKWGPYLSERQWGTVREDYSESGDAWNYFPHDHARSRTYRWGEDGIAGVSDERQRLCFALALWNEKDPILKERLFGLSNREGNHGEDVKECYFYLDSTPTHSYMKYLYKYPQAAYPYDELVAVNRGRDRNSGEYELVDTGVFDDDHYFDVFVEYAKATPEDLLIQITVCNRGATPAKLHLLPTLWFRDTWSNGGGGKRPTLEQRDGRTIAASHSELGDWLLHAEGAGRLLFTENETNTQRIAGSPNRTPYVKDGINEYIVHGCVDAVNPAQRGTKAAAHYSLTVKGGASATVRLRLGASAQTGTAPFGSGFDMMMKARQQEADEFYASVIPDSMSAEQGAIMRQALAGMLWSKQFYYYDIKKWLTEHGCDPFQPGKRAPPRNEHWHHMYNADILSMPDKWEYPWYATWDLGFHVVALTLVDEDFGKQQLELMLQSEYQHPNGQIPAYEWNLSDVNPPVHAWATAFTYRLAKARRGGGDIEWLERCFHKLMLNFAWWVNRKDRLGNNVFEGGFLGLDNIGVFDRSAPLPTGGHLEQADGTAWMALFCQNMLEIASELARERPTYLPMCRKFVEHFLWIASSMIRADDDPTGMWDEEDGFFYDVLRLPDRTAQRLKVRSMVGLLPLCAVTVFEGDLLSKDPLLTERLLQFLESRPKLRAFIHDPLKVGCRGSRLTSILDEARLRRVLSTMLDEQEFLGPYGIRALSRVHGEHPYIFRTGKTELRVPYLPAESNTDMFGGNSNWRGPVWMPVNALIIRALLQYHLYYGAEFKVECPTGSGRLMDCYQIAEEITRRLASIFLPDKDGRRPVHGEVQKFQDDPHFRDLIPFYEYFHGDTGAGLGASHQTGWTGVIARLMHIFATSSADEAVKLGKAHMVTSAIESDDRAHM
jgi:hypothetical protein